MCLDSQINSVIPGANETGGQVYPVGQTFWGSQALQESRRQADEQGQERCKVVLGYVGAEEGNFSPRERTCWGLPPGSRAVSPRNLHPLFCPCTQRALKHTHTPNSPKRKEKESESEVAQISLSDSL